MIAAYLIPLGCSAVVTSVGLALRSSSAYGGYSSGLIGIGVAGAACVGACVVAHVFQIGRSKTPHTGDMEALRTLSEELASISEAVDRKGILALAESKVSVCPDVYRMAADRAIGGASAESIRSDVQAAMERQMGGESGSGARSVLVSQVMSVLALLVALVVVGLSVTTNVIAGFSDGAALGVMLLVYGSFMMTVIAQEQAGRVQAMMRRGTLASAMIGESLALMRFNASPGVIRAEMERLLAPGATPVRETEREERQAA